jgi:hypothetical protein
MIFFVFLSPLRGDAALRPVPGCAPGGAVTFFCFAKRKSPKKRRPHFAGRPRADFSALLGLAGKGLKLARFACSDSRPFLSVQPCAARRLRRGPQRVARFAGIPSTSGCGAVCSLGVAAEYSFSAHTTHPVRTEVSKCHANPSTPQGKRDVCGGSAQDRMPAQRATLAGPRLSRRAAQRRPEKEAHMFESRTRGEFVGFPADASSAEKLALGQPAQWGRLFFREFLLAKCLDRGPR